MFNKIKDLLMKVGSKINVAGILVIVAVGVAVGVAFTLGEWQLGLVFLFGGGLVGMALAWIRSSGVGK